MVSDRREATELLAEDILENIELGDITLAAVMLKCARLARLLGDESARQVFAYEAGGYPSGPDGVPAAVFELGRRPGRVYFDKGKDGAVTERMNTASVEALESSIAAKKTALGAAADRNVSLSSANPSQFVMAPVGNVAERQRLAKSIADTSATLARSRAFAYEYANAALHELRFSAAASDIFDRVSQTIDVKIINVAPLASQKTASINENLRSENPEDWANAVHGCRRLLQEVADALFPPAPDRQLPSGKTIKLGPDNYINRLLAFVESRSGSARFTEIVGSTLSYVGERLDAVFKAAQKGSHSEIGSRDEAERYVIYTYLTVGDIIALR